MPKGIYKRTPEMKIGNLLGRKHTKETKEKISKSKKGKHHSEEVRSKIRETLKGKPSNVKGKHWHLSDKAKENIRKGIFEYAKRITGIICPRIGKHEKQILDELEKKLNYRIIRQYEISGYYLDGYIPEINLVIEVDEKPKNIEKDIKRENFIKQKLGCKFLRIKDYD